MILKEFPTKDSTTIHHLPITRLMLQTSTAVNENHIRKLLELQDNECIDSIEEKKPEKGLSDMIYQRLINVVAAIAEELYSTHKMYDVKQYPLTSIYELNIYVADKFPFLFYKPVYPSLCEQRIYNIKKDDINAEEEEEDDDDIDKESVLFQKNTSSCNLNYTQCCLIKRVPKFIEFWPITLLLKDAYITVLNNKLKDVDCRERI